MKNQNWYFDIKEMGVVGEKSKINISKLRKSSLKNCINMWDTWLNSFKYESDYRLYQYDTNGIIIKIITVSEGKRILKLMSL